MPVSRVTTFAQLLRARLRGDEDGQGLAEYALILSLIAVVAIGSLALLGPAIADQLDEVASAFQEEVAPKRPWCDFYDQKSCELRSIDSLN